MMAKAGVLIARLWRALFGLFVDDGILAIAITAWLLIARALLPRLGLWNGQAVALAGGFLAILAESALRAGRHDARKTIAARSRRDDGSDGA